MASLARELARSSGSLHRLWITNQPWRHTITTRGLGTTTNNSSTTTTSDNGDNGNKKTPSQEIKKSVFISQSHDIFTNLALEDWIYRNYNFSKHHVLMLWINDPCVVVGRHQNPFDEVANVSDLLRKGIVLARRNSGGGTVYHDSGNLNCTFFTPRDRYNRKYNLNLITRALFREWTIKADISDRDDILLRGKKISGTAAKLGQPNAYHHCTLLVNSNKANLGGSLAKEKTEKIISRASKSVPSPIKNLVDVNSHVNISQLLSAIGYEFLRTNATELVDGGREQVMRQQGFQLINPTEKWFPGITELRNTFSSWDWRFGKTPEFSVERKLQRPEERQQVPKGDVEGGGVVGGRSSGGDSGSSAAVGGDGKRQEVTLKVDVKNGLISEIKLLLGDNADPISVVSQLKGSEYNEDNFNSIYESLKTISPDTILSEAINGS